MLLCFLCIFPYQGSLNDINSFNVSHLLDLLADIIFNTIEKDIHSVPFAHKIVRVLISTCSC